MRHRIQFPSADKHDFAQDEIYFYVLEGDRRKKLRFHDYDEIYSRPGLYEQLFYERLQCVSPRKVRDLLGQTLRDQSSSDRGLRVLDLGAGNGMMGEEVRQLNAARVVGVDIIPEAREAAFRDRPHAYDDYLVADMTNLSEEQSGTLSDWRFDCLTSVAALGFGDIPPRAFFEALRFLATGGWVAFNIKETFLDRSDQSGFSTFVRELIFSKYIDIHHLELYDHRRSMEGVPLKYYALVGRLGYQIPADFLDKVGVTDGQSEPGS